MSWQFKGAIEKITTFLFGKEGDSDFLDMRTRIQDKDMYKAILFYRVIQKKFNCETAKLIADTMERLSISVGGKGREEGVETLKQKPFPRVQRILTGVEEIGEETG